VATRLMSVQFYRFEFCQGYGCHSVVSVACCQVDVSEMVDHLSRGDQPSVVCLGVILKPQQ
jgi:hypothetical protein